MPWAAIAAAVIAFFQAWFGGKKKDPEVEEAKHDQAIAEKQAAILADDTRPDVVEQLRRGEF